MLSLPGSAFAAPTVGLIPKILDYCTTTKEVAS